MKKTMKPGSKMPGNEGETVGEAGGEYVAESKKGVGRGNRNLKSPTAGRTGTTAKGVKIGRPPIAKKIKELGKPSKQVAPIPGGGGSVCDKMPISLQSHLLTPEAVFAWNEALAGLAIESMKGAPKKILISKVGDLKILDDLFRRAQGITGGGGNDRPGNLIQVNILSDIGKERPENVRVVTSPIAEPVDS